MMEFLNISKAEEEEGTLAASGIAIQVRQALPNSRSACQKIPSFMEPEY
jgi:hypothetical protein